MKNPLKRLWRALPLMRYGSEQHELICNATKVSKDYKDEGCTAYESVCVLLTKLDHARSFIKSKDWSRAKETLDLLNADQDSDAFGMLYLYGTEKDILDHDFNQKVFSGLKKVSNFKSPCLNRSHSPPEHIVLSPGEYEYKCPACGHVTHFSVPLVSL